MLQHYRGTGPRGHVDDPRWQLVQRIAESRSLGRSALLADFLFYVSDRQIRGRTSEITEQQIGVQVFGRLEGYNSNDDNIVRNYARTLRKRIEEYFATEGRQEPLKLVIPRGGYIPVFSPKEAEPSSLESTRVPVPMETARESTLGNPRQVGTDEALLSRVASDQLSAHPPKNIDADPVGTKAPEVGRIGAEKSEHFVSSGKRWYLPWAAFTIMLSALAGYIAAHGMPGIWSRGTSPYQQPSHLLWRRLFENNRDTFVVPADGGLVMMQSFTRHHVLLPDYVSGSYRSRAEIAQGVVGLLKSTNSEDNAQLARKVEVLAARRYTSVVDLDLTTHLSQIKEVVPERLMIRYARDLRIDDLRTGNVILIGSSDANPWVDLFQQQLNFQFARGLDFGGSETIVNHHPLPGEQETYASVPNDLMHRTYGVIAYLPNLEGSGHVLIVEGVNMAGTQAAGSFLLSPDQMQPMLRRVLDKNGEVQPFEILLETSSVGANASRPQVLSERLVRVANP
jgi:hypothetical protein